MHNKQSLRNLNCDKNFYLDNTTYLQEYNFFSQEIVQMYVQMPLPPFAPLSFRGIQCGQPSAGFFPFCFENQGVSNEERV